MDNTDMISFYGQGEGSVLDQKSDRQNQPRTDEVQSLEWKSTKDADGNYVFKATRKLDTEDNEDKVLELNKEMNFFWTERETDGNPSSQYTSDGALKLTLSSEGPTFIKTIVWAGNDRVYFIHGVAMWFTWGLFGLLLFLSNRWWSYKSDWVQAPHSLAAMAVFWLSAWSFIHVVNKTSFKLDDVHQIVGFTLLIGVLISQVGGVVTYRQKQTIKWKTAKVIENKKYHGTAGTVTLILSIFAIGTGLWKFTTHVEALSHFKWLAPFFLFGWLAVYGAFEFWFRKTRMGHDEIPSLVNYPVISQEDFETRVQKGEMLYVLDNMVLNLTNYAHHHPGGRFLLDQTAGRDISKFFYGGYALDGNIGLKPGDKNMAYAHSNIARKTAFNHIVGVIENPEVQENSFQIDHSQSMDLNSSSKSFVFKTKDE